MDVSAPRPGDNGQLKSYVERLVRLHEEKRNLAEDIKELFQEVKSAGFVPKQVRAVVKAAMETDEERGKRLAHEENVEMMKAALGMLSDLPLGTAAVERT